MIEVTVRPAPGALGAAFSCLPREGEVTIHLEPGVYREKAVLSRPDTILEGSGADNTLITWDDGAFTILEDGMKRGTFRSYTLMLDGDRITMRNLTVENAASPREKVGQAVALYADGDGILVEDCVLKSYQDTLFTAPLPPKEFEPRGFIGPKEFAPRKPQRQTYRRCRISGDVDFIFGGAAAWFEDCEIVAEDGRTDRSGDPVAYCTAASTPEGQRFGYVFSHCRFTAENYPDGTVYLGRPWREFAKTVLLRCEIGSHIRPEGFHDWGKESFHRNGLYAEYACTGAGAGTNDRAPFARQLTDEEAAEYTYEAFSVSLD